MYQVVLGKVSTLSAGQLPDALIAQAPQGVRRASWLAGRVLLSRALSAFSPYASVRYFTPHMVLFSYNLH
ncbi:hypothetical protein A3219_09275 [Salmonella enterica]|nr:hypothetical protein A3219_09275 [Salmonella enterica]